MSALATGRLDNDTVVVEDTAEANRLHNKSLAGNPESGNTLRLHRVEAIHCVERGWLRIEGSSVASLLADAAKESGRLEVEYLCYRDLRERGLTVRIQPNGSMQVWARGATTKQEPWFTTMAHAERVSIRAEELLEWAGQHVSVVDEDGAVTHYQSSVVALQGDLGSPTLPTMQGTILDDRVLVADSDAAAALAAAALGTPHGDGRVLSLLEAESLRRRDVLDLDADIVAHAQARHPDFDVLQNVHDALDAAGVLTKSGFRFGTHLRGYAADPDTVHAEWLIHCAAPERELQWSDLSRGIRLAHGVRKKFLVAVAANPVQFVELSWFRP